ncbi:protein-L-isoaspartate(D-aspartate) O-methyltransferase [Rhodospira trueperi]|uniref:Protein-L-isoaspartate O-methyltransferase n=2 Tax=Rhodospira trueperi TaxID=69960 RepID=A0A1G6WJ93_9PROT|nr:protein-L-isoaspartate(D-aspartate) O-methyltransferase [Rhodospira trueperi]SDD65854.1 protein-L-isoaspartate(D-aspartate) O-methyltransferase [Rhodospira trueperi]
MNGGAHDHKIRLLMDLRRTGVTDTRVLSALETVPREVFVSDPFLEHAYDNRALPIDCGQTISQPLVVGLMTQYLTLGPRDKVLEIGTGSGYQAAVLSKVARRVYTVERHAPLLAQAEARFKHLSLTNIVTRHGDGMKGWPEQAPFTRIMVTAAARQIPEGLADQLDDGGVMVLPVGDADQQWVMRVTRSNHRLHTERLLAVRFVPLLDGVPDHDPDT